jgi:CDP-diacylglycerol---glycerol-3-phosphate 3-phosphatidyltransferase
MATIEILWMPGSGTCAEMGHGTKQPAVQRVVDAFVRRAFLWAIPRRVLPNHVTIVRFVLTPVVVLLFVLDQVPAAVVAFVIAAATDFIDGAMARSRDQVTPLGTTIDPIADKLLIGAMLACVGWGYLVVKVIVVALALELVFVVVNYLANRRNGRVLGANWFGKTKMILQVLGVGLFLLARLLGLDTLVTVSLWLLWASLVLAVVSAILQARAGASSLSQEERTA